MRFLDVNDFLNRPYKIPNIEESREFIDDYIEDEETKILKKILGLRLYNEFIEGLDTSGTIEQKWIDLRDGAEYESGSNLYEYRGLVDFLKPYICSKWVEINFRKATTSGVIVNNGQQNTQTVVPDYERVQYWNEFVEKVGGSCAMENTLYGFLKANESDYEDLVFTQHKVINTLDI
jgi:hypothetical protein